MILEDHTKLKNDNVELVDEDTDRKMYDLICEKLKKEGYIHYEVSNFAKEGYESVHNLNYWNNGEYYGFGLGAGGYKDAFRYTNTKNLHEYIEPTKNRADMIIKKHGNHEISDMYIRKF